MRLLAAETGGIAFFNMNDLASAIRQAMGDSEASYTLGFYPTPSLLDGKYHELRVETPGRPGVTLRCRKGYYAEDREVPGAGSVQSAIDEALASPVEARRITISVQVHRTADSFEIEMTTAPQQLSLEEVGDRMTGTIDVVTAQLDDRGNVVFAAAQTAAVNVGRGSYAESARTGVRYATSMKVKPGARQFRVIVVDRTTRAVGSVIIPIAEIRE